jgi:hypothetical protein
MSGPQDIVTELRSWGNAGADDVMHRAADEIVRLEQVVLALTAERDEARWDYCLGFTDFCPNPAHDDLPLDEAAAEVAKAFGWSYLVEEGKS